MLLKNIKNIEIRPDKKGYMIQNLKDSCGVGLVANIKGIQSEDYG